MSRQIKSFLCAALTVLAWSTVSTAFKISLAVMSPARLVFVSMGTASVFLGVVLLAGKISAAPGPGAAAAWKYASLQGVLLYSYYMLLFFAYDRLPVQIAQPVNYTWSLMLVALAAPLLGQRVSAKSLACMLLAYGGVVIIALGRGGAAGPPDPAGMVCVVASTMLYALYWIINTRSPLPNARGLFFSFALACALAGITLLLSGQPLLPTPRRLLPAVYVGMFELAVPFLLWGMALRLTSSVARLSTLPFLVPFLALFWIRLILGEPVARATVPGLVCIVAGTLLQQYFSRKENVAFSK
jgi:drug/metabolite transporter (DMT)-like permease